MSTYFRFQLLLAAWGGALLARHFIGQFASVATALATLAFVAYVVARFTLSWISFSGFHAAAIGLVLLHATTPLAQRIEGHPVAFVAIPFLVSALLFGLSPLMPAPVPRNAARADRGGSGA